MYKRKVFRLDFRLTSFINKLISYYLKLIIYIRKFALSEILFTHLFVLNNRFVQNKVQNILFLFKSDDIRVKRESLKMRL